MVFGGDVFRNGFNRCKQNTGLMLRKDEGKVSVEEKIQSFQMKAAPGLQALQESKAAITPMAGMKTTGLEVEDEVLSYMPKFHLCVDDDNTAACKVAIIVAELSSGTIDPSMVRYKVLDDGNTFQIQEGWHPTMLNPAELTLFLATEKGMPHHNRLMRMRALNGEVKKICQNDRHREIKSQFNIDLPFQCKDRPSIQHLGTHKQLNYLYVELEHLVSDDWNIRDEKKGFVDTTNKKEAAV